MKKERDKARMKGRIGIKKRQKQREDRRKKEEAGIEERRETEERKRNSKRGWDKGKIGRRGERKGTANRVKRGRNDVREEGRREGCKIDREKRGRKEGRV